MGRGSRWHSLAPAYAAAPTPITGQHLEPQVIHVHPLDLVLHALKFCGAVVVSQMVHVASWLLVLWVGENRIVLDLGAAEAL